MPSTFFGLNIAYSGLQASNAALNTTANNISNADTIGYSRQAVSTKASDALRTFTTYGCAGAGVDTLAIERLRNEFYDMRYWNNNAKLGEYNIKQYYMSEIQDYFTDSRLQPGFTTYFEQMYASLQDIIDNAASPTTKSTFVNYANDLCEYFNSMAENLERVQLDLNEEVKNKTDEINSLAQEIASLNKQINVIELTGSQANELRDQRAVLVDKLSLITTVEISENPILDSNNSDRHTGATRFSVNIAGGQTLVDGSEYRQLECVARESWQKVNQSDADGLYDIVWKNDGSEFGMYADTIGGELMSLLQMRDGNNGEYLSGNITGYDSDTGKATIKVPAGSAFTDMDKNTLSDTGGVVKIGNVNYHYDAWEYDENTGEYTFDISQDAKKNSAMLLGKLNNMAANDAAASVGSRITYQGIPYYQEQMNEWAREFARAFNNILTQPDSVDAYGDPAGILFTAKHATDTGQFTFGDEGNGKYSSRTDTYNQITAKNFAVSAAILGNAELLGTHTNASDGESKYDVISDLIDLKTNRDKMTFRGCAAGQFLECVLADVALNANRANNFQTTYEAVAKSIENQRLSVSGVDSDEEALDLVQFQNSYNLASKMMQVFTEVLDRLILQTGV